MWHTINWSGFRRAEGWRRGEIQGLEQGTKKMVEIRYRCDVKRLKTTEFSAKDFLHGRGSEEGGMGWWEQCAIFN
jgi:hypothetical protein